jgi:hypothetical protein
MFIELSPLLPALPNLERPQGCLFSGGGGKGSR